MIYAFPAVNVSMHVLIMPKTLNSKDIAFQLVEKVVVRLF